MADPWSLLINAFTALGTIFLIWWLQSRPEKKRKEKRKGSYQVIRINGHCSEYSPR
ncbi:hypothetical protein ES704_03599 [subsurface metagenome]|jgi:preprotein translocase subunit YajC